MWGFKEQWRAVRTLVLDEASMADAEFVDYAEATVREIIGELGTERCPWARPNQVFGGIQLIFCGDFAQLPPIEEPVT